MLRDRHAGVSDSDGQGDTVEPVVGAAVAKALGAAGDEASQEATRLLSRVLGPAADEIGAALGRYTALRVQNVGRVIQKADRKRGGREQAGSVPPRLAHRLLEEGSYCDDELMAEYLAGMLAGGQSTNGRDDRAVVWSAMVSSMSTLQIRGHFLFYREWAAALRERTDLNLGVYKGATDAAIHVELADFMLALVGDLGVSHLDALVHTVPALHRLGLIQEYAWGRAEEMPGKGSGSPFPRVITAAPTIQGIELYGWAQGMPGMQPRTFLTSAEVFAEEEIPRPKQVAFPRLPAQDVPPAGPES